MAGTITANTPTRGEPLQIGVASSSEWVVGSPTQMRLASGTVSLDGSNPTSVTTGLVAITGALITLQASAAPADASAVFSYTVSAGGVLNIYAWQNTGGTDPTFTASANSETMAWLAWGVS